FGGQGGDSLPVSTTPSPALPTRGRVLPCARVWIVPSAPDYTLPLVGRAGEGVEADAERATIRPWTKWQERAASLSQHAPPGGLAYRLPHRHSPGPGAALCLREPDLGADAAAAADRTAGGVGMAAHRHHLRPPEGGGGAERGRAVLPALGCR